MAANNDGRTLAGITRRQVVAGGLMAGAAALAAGNGLESPRPAQAEGDAPSQVILTMTTGSEPAAGFDPLVSWGCGEHVHEPLIQSTLITTDINLEFQNDLATSYECSEDGLTWTFTIRDDVKFTDGEPLTAHDVAFTVNGIINSSAAEADLSMVDEAVVVDDTTVELHLNKPFNALLYTLAVMGIVPEHAYGPDYGANPIGSGRYMLEQWDKGQQVILKANPDYYGEPVKMQRVVVVFMEEDASIAAAQAGQVDVAYTSATYYDIVPVGYELLACASVDSRGVSLPCVPAGGTKSNDGVDYAQGNDVTCDVAVRRALNYATDRNRLISNVLNGYGTPAFSVGDGLPWSSEDMVCETDAELARQILEDAGWVDSGDGIRAKDGIRCAFDLYYTAGDSARQGIAMEWANQMREIGVEVNPKGGSWDELYLHQYECPIEWGWGSNAPIEMYELNYSTGWGNFSSYENATVDAHLDEALAQTHIEDSYDLWKKAQWDGEQGVAPQGAATWVWLTNIDHLYYVRDGLQVAEQKPHPHGHGWSLANNIDQWSWN
ncbi:MAG: ABC transporter substrate-binding protein [Coriobacteriales bacterium]|nr:ABC transporter substrate-binding protein [Coriobacteriales bacterium]